MSAGDGKGAGGFDGPRRFVTRQGDAGAAFLAAARGFVARLDPERRAWLYRKPFDPSPGNPAFYWGVCQVLLLLQAMRVRPGGRILEVGSGSGWVSEILVGLGFRVDGVEPSADMIAIARERLEGFVALRRIGGPPAWAFHPTTLEDCELPERAFDAVLFHEALHHVIDEDRALAACFRLLRPRGVLGVTEDAWLPGDPKVEAPLVQEMADCGTHESPFTIAYLDHLLAAQGFEDLVRYHGVFHLVPAAEGERSVRDSADVRADRNNMLTARRPADGPDSRNPVGRVDARLTVEEARIEPGSGLLRLRLRLVNTGEVAWIAGPGTPGTVTVAIHQGEPGGAGFREAPRQTLPDDVLPGESIELAPALRLPDAAGGGPWLVELVDEGHFWFRERGVAPVPLPPVHDRG